jgi:hypothetical protein
MPQSVHAGPSARNRGTSRPIVPRQFDASPPKPRLGVVPVLLAPLLAAVLLTACSHSGAGGTRNAPTVLINGAAYQPVFGEPIYLEGPAAYIKRSDVERFVCRNGEPLECDCAGKLGNCRCQCPLY